MAKPDYKSAGNTPGTPEHARKFLHRREPFTDLLVRRTPLVEEAPGVAPAALAPLFYLAGYPMLMDARTGGRMKKKWLRVIEHDPVLLRWLRSDDAFIPPEEWPDEVQDQLDGRDLGHIIPGFWARDFIPEGRRTRGWATIYRYCYEEHWGGIRALSAIANGWPVSEIPEEDLEAIPDSLDSLMRQATFQIWAWNPYLECLPTATRPYRSAIHGRVAPSGKKGGRVKGADDMGVLLALESRAILEQDPLAVSVSDQYQALAKHSRRLIPSLPRRPWTSRSTRPNMVGLYYEREPVRV